MVIWMLFLWALCIWGGIQLIKSIVRNIKQREYKSLALNVGLSVIGVSIIVFILKPVTLTLKLIEVFQ